MEFNGFDISTEFGRAQAIHWLKNATGQDMFFSDHDPNASEEDDIFDSITGEMRRGIMLEYLKSI